MSAKHPVLAIVLGTALGFVTVTTSHAQGQPSPVAASPADGPMPRLVALLDDPSYQVRQDASAQLVASTDITLPMIEATLANAASLSPEQRERLISAGRTRFERSPRGAMGIRPILTGLLRDRIIIDQTVPNFPCARLLEEGDILESADGARLVGPEAWELLRALIIAHEPGEVLSVVVLRGKDRLALDIPLGRYADLEGGGVDARSIPRAWNLRASRLLTRSEPPIRSGITAADWRETDALVRSRQAQMMADRVTGKSPRSLVESGGKPRAVISEEAAMARWNINQQQAFLGGPQRAVMFNGVVNAEGFFPTMTPEEELAELQAYIEVMKSQLDKNRAAGADPVNLKRAGNELVAGEVGAARQIRIAQKLSEAIKAHALQSDAEAPQQQ
ncbi:MAG: hypothetical protein KF745_12605 [Phycisphaeraceae bacterium]|nr:hypothetical protein [Phycisphaeraceae bacterium]